MRFNHISFLSVLLVTFSCNSGKNTFTRTLNNTYTTIELSEECTCEIDEEVKHVNRYKPPMNVLLDYEQFESSSHWTLENKEDDYKKIYFTNMRAGTNMSLISREPIKLSHKNGALTLNFTPCIYKNKYYKLPFFSVNIPRQDYRDDNEDFDYSALAYFDYLTAGTNMHEGTDTADLLKEILEERFYYEDYDGSKDFELHISGIRKKYNISVKEHETLDSGINPVDKFIKELVNSEIDISNFIVTEYVLTENTKHKINEEEKGRLKRILSNHNDLLFEQIDFKLKNKLYRGALETKRTIVEINTDIIRKWDVTGRKALLDSVGLATKADVLLYTQMLYFSNHETDKVKVDSICTTTSEITGTGILLNFDRAKLIFPQKMITYNPRNLQLNLKNYPFFKNSTYDDKKRSNFEIARYYDAPLTNFTGLLIPQTNVQIPINDVMLMVRGNDIIINNFFISGIFEIKLQPTANLDQHLKLATDKLPIQITKNDLIAHFNKLGLKQVELSIEENTARVFFKKNSRN